MAETEIGILRFCATDPQAGSCMLHKAQAAAIIAEIDALRRLNESLAERIAAQSELLTKRAEK